ncbi:DMT family transporter [Ancylobacter sp. G4_0304]|uniref:DMT family transporter n=1 Tax=Ancylobacter sp. G4_0304 TaxID=3114289 RepID=UPI0039C758E6
MHNHSANTRGILLMIAGSCFFAGNDALSKLALTAIPSSQVLAVRGAMAGVVLLALLAMRGELPGLRHAFDRLVMLRAVIEAVSAVLFITAISVISIGDAAAIIQVAPLVTMALAVLLFGTKLSWQRWLAVITGFLGVALIVKPGAHGFDPMASLPFLCAFLIAFRDFITGRIGAHIPTLVVTLVTAMVGMMLGFGGSAIQEWQPLDGPVLMLLAVGSVTLVLGHMFTIGAFRGTDPALITPFRYATVVCSVALSAIIFQNPPDLVSIAGMAMIVAAGLYTMHNHRASHKAALATTAAAEREAV